MYTATAIAVVTENAIEIITVLRRLAFRLHFWVAE
jgi:hypothetical protein